MSAVLQVEDLSVRYGGVVALDEITFSTSPGSILGFIGPNGAGKTTLFDAISGFVRPDRGRIQLDGVELAGLSPERRSLLGLGRSFQDARLVPSLTVKENLQLAFQRQVRLAGPLAVAIGLLAQRQEERRLGEQAEELLALLHLQAFRDKFVSELSTGSRRVVDLAMVLAAQPSVLLLDEPSSGIAQRETEALGPLIRTIRDQLDCTVLVIEHDMPLITSIADEIIALEAGRAIASGSPAQVLGDPRVVAAYLGTQRNVIERSRVTVGPKLDTAPSTPSAERVRPAGSGSIRTGPSWAHRTAVVAAALLAAGGLYLARSVVPSSLPPVSAATPSRPAAIVPSPVPAPSPVPPALFPTQPLNPPSFAFPPPPAAEGAPPPPPPPSPSPSPSPGPLDQACALIPLAICPSPTPVP